MIKDPRDDHDDDDNLLADVVKRAFQAGKRTVKNGQESIKNIASEILNNDAVEAVGDALHGVREDAVKLFGKEVTRYFDRLDLTDAIVKVLTMISLEVKTEIRFIPNDKKFVKPDVKGSVTVKTIDDQE